MMLIDSHVNLHGERYKDDLADVLARSKAAGVGGMLTICDQLSSVPEITDIVRTHGTGPDGARNMWRTVGIHPHHAKDYIATTADDLIALAAFDDVVGIGESGLDQYYNYSPTDAQLTVFHAHVDAAMRLALPLVIHTRDADEMMEQILRAGAARPGAGTLKPLLHCYTGGPDLARSVLDLGGYVSFSGILTFRNADLVRSVARLVPLDRVLIETDCPFLAPVPHRGRRNEPAFVRHVAEALAEVKGVSTGTIAETTTENFFRLFDKAVSTELTRAPETPGTVR